MKKMKCSKCNTNENIVRVLKYDSDACIMCNIWTEEPCKCGGDECEAFPKRPEVFTSDILNTSEIWYYNPSKR